MGGAKKSFSTDKILLEKTNLTITELFEHLIQIKPSDTLEFDTNNLLVAINGVDSSVLDGYNTSLKDNDVVSIIPIIHGGKPDRIQFGLLGSNVELFDIMTESVFRKRLFEKQYHRDSLDKYFLDELRDTHKQLTIQAINPRFLLGIQHVKKILAISFQAEKTKTMLSNKIEIDILLRFAATTQISTAIKVVGRKVNHDCLIIAFGDSSSLNKLYSELKPFINLKPLSRDNHLFLKRQFSISKNQMSVVQSKDPLEDVIVEKSAVLV